jgi:hypothetical protein
MDKEGIEGTSSFLVLRSRGIGSLKRIDPAQLRANLRAVNRPSGER